MQERGDLVQDEKGRWIEGPVLDWEVLPARVEGVIEERLSQLPPRLRELLRVASVQGEEFGAEVLADLVGEHGGVGGDGVDQLIVLVKGAMRAIAAFVLRDDQRSLRHQAALETDQRRVLRRLGQL